MQVGRSFGHFQVLLIFLHPLVKKAVSTFTFRQPDFGCHMDSELQMLQLIFGINLFSENPPLSFFMFLQPKEVMLLE